VSEVADPLLLVDIGNSRIHLGLSDRSGLRRADLPHARRAELAPTLLALARGERIASAAAISVRDAATLADVRTSLDQVGCKSMRVFADARDLPLRMAVRSPETVGLDRLMNVLGARSLAAGTHVVLDFGTALTVSVLDAGDQFLGGAISPGWQLMAHALAQGTARLPLVQDMAGVAYVGKDTREAIASGIRHAVIGGARELIRGTLAELASPATVWATGGDAARFAPELPEVNRVDPDLTLRGLRLVFEGSPAMEESQRGRER
jgi:type III pantothenate kinase